MNIEKMFGNKFIKDAAFSTLKKAMRAGKNTAIVILYDANTDELDFKFVPGDRDEDDVVVISIKDFETYKNAVLSLIEKEDKGFIEYDEISEPKNLEQ